MNVALSRVRGFWYVLCVAGSLALVACDDGETPPAAVVDASTTPDARVPSNDPGPDASATLVDASELARDGGVEPADAAAPVDAYVPPAVAFPTVAPTVPFLLSQVGLYSDSAHQTLAPDLISYEPTYKLWSDGAQKDRHLRVPAGAHIDNTDVDHWQFPVGTVLFKEFAKDGKKLETRVIARTGEGARDYFFGAFVWRADQSDAELTWEGENNVLGTEHDVPSVKQCGTCHNGEPGRVLGISAVQSVAVVSPLLKLPVEKPYRVPGSETEARALGYLHANCGHCHNPSGSARPDTDLILRLSTADQTVAETTTYRSSVGVALQSFQGSTLTLRVAAGQPEQSGLYFRMSQRGPRTQMPPIATEAVDEVGLAAVSSFIAGLPH
ncbi:MAG: hypothetical protein JWN48_1472 [Myxococcaceae bacterium]|nr:hypothetical protein [Myxococcaceae bacterium]